MRKDEHMAAVAFVNWWAVMCRGFGVSEILLFAVPNGGARHPAVAKALKAEGVRAGVSDYFLSVSRGQKHGLFIELKRGGVGVPRGYATSEQLNFGALVQDQGYSFVVAHGAIEAEDAVGRYLTQR